MTDFDVLQLLGQGFGYAYLQSVQTHGGILLAWSLSSWSASNMVLNGAIFLPP
jgi:hypothetical protein